jgi:DNA-binding IclR family transcriptional regulator
VYIATAESARAIRHVGWVGRTVPLTGTAVGATLTGTGEATVLRNTGSVEPDVAAAVAPVLGTEGTVVAAISVLGPSSRLDNASTDTATIAVLAAAEALSHDLRGPT